MTNVHQKALADRLRCSFVNLEVQSNADVDPGKKQVHHLILNSRGQVMHSGGGNTQATIFLLYHNNHFDLLEECAGETTDSEMLYVWDMEVQSMQFRLHAVAKDHACGWTSTARALNLARVPCPADLQAPPLSDELDLFPFPFIYFNL